MLGKTKKIVTNYSQFFWQTCRQQNKQKNLRPRSMLRERERESKRERERKGEGERERKKEGGSFTASIFMTLLLPML